MKVRYPIKYQKDVDPPPRRVGSVPRWKDVTDNLKQLAADGGVLHVKVPQEYVAQEIKSLRNAVYRAKKRQGITTSFSVQTADDGINLWRMEDSKHDVARSIGTGNQG